MTHSHNLLGEPPATLLPANPEADGELAACFHAAQLAVLPYREIEQSGVLATALAFGTPVNFKAAHIEGITCTHESTHRGGAIWEICDDCGDKWADDRGGKPAFKWPECVEKARALLNWG